MKSFDVLEPVLLTVLTVWTGQLYRSRPKSDALIGSYWVNEYWNPAIGTQNTDAIHTTRLARLRWTQDAHDEVNLFLREPVTGIAAQPLAFGGCFGGVIDPRSPNHFVIHNQGYVFI